MLIYEVLKKDHEIVKQLLQQMEESSEGAIRRRRELLERFREELIPHARAEEKVLYDTLKDLPGTEDLVLEAYEEHSTAEMILRELELMDPSDDRWLMKLGVLRENLEHHIEEEEDEIFANAQHILAPEEAQMMAEAFLNLKMEIKEGSLLHNALEKIAPFMPARFSHRFSDLAKRV